MDVTLEACGFFDLVEKNKIFSAYDIQQWKPDPGLFIHAAEEMGINPKRSIVIEDSLSGVRAALNASMEVLVYNPHDDPKTMIPGVRNFRDMPGMQNYLSEYGITSFAL